MKEAMMLRFVSGYYNFSYWRSLQLKSPMDQIEMENLNLFQWILFFNDHRVLNHLLINTPVGKNITITQCLTGDHQPMEYIIKTDPDDDNGITLTFEKVGLIISILR